MTPEEAHLSNRQTLVLIRTQLVEGHVATHMEAATLGVEGVEDFRRLAFAAVHEAVGLVRKLATATGRSPGDIMEDLDEALDEHMSLCTFARATG